MKNNQVDVESIVALADRAFDGEAKQVQMARDLASDCANVTGNISLTRLRLVFLEPRSQLLTIFSKQL